MKDTRTQEGRARPGAGGTGADLAPGKRTLIEGVEAGPAGALLTPDQIERARRNNPIYHAQLKYDPKVFGAGDDVTTEAFALAVAKYQKDHGLAVDGMAGPITAKNIGTPAHPEPAG